MLSLQRGGAPTALTAVNPASTVGKEVGGGAFHAGRPPRDQQELALIIKLSLPFIYTSQTSSEACEVSVSQPLILSFNDITCLAPQSSPNKSLNHRFILVHFLRFSCSVLSPGATLV